MKNVNIVCIIILLLSGNAHGGNSYSGPSISAGGYVSKANDGSYLGFDYQHVFINMSIESKEIYDEKRINGFVGVGIGHRTLQLQLGGSREEGISIVRMRVRFFLGNDLRYRLVAGYERHSDNDLSNFFTGLAYDF